MQPQDIVLVMAAHQDAALHACRSTTGALARHTMGRERRAAHDCNRCISCAVMSRPAFCITRKRPPPVQVSDVKTTAASGGHLISNSHHGDGAEVDCQDVGTAAFVRQRNHHSPR